jgi:hypothetical protein
MSNAIVTVIMTALMLAGVSILAQGSFTAVSDLSESWKDMEGRSSALSRTDISALTVSYATPTLDVTLVNTGGEALRDFGKWDVVAQYYETDGTYQTTYLTFTTATTTGDNEWRMEGIYLDASANTAEAHQPQILDPGEELVISLSMTPTADTSANNVIVIGTPNGVTVSKPF